MKAKIDGTVRPKVQLQHKPKHKKIMGKGIWGLERLSVPKTGSKRRRGAFLCSYQIGEIHKGRKWKKQGRQTSES